MLQFNFLKNNDVYCLIYIYGEISSANSNIDEL